MQNQMVATPTDSRRSIDRSACKNQRLKRHGTYSSFRYGCTCPDAVEENRLYQKRYRGRRLPSRRIPAVGIARRICALQAIGWPLEDIARRAGTTPQAINQVKRQKWVQYDKAQRLLRIYDELSMTPGPSGITRSRARTAGHAPPLAWWGRDIDNPDALPDLAGPDEDVVDEVVVQRLTAGVAPSGFGTRAERQEAARRIYEATSSPTEMSRRLRISGRTAQSLVWRLIHQPRRDAVQEQRTAA
jgi:hypothetical protein